MTTSKVLPLLTVKYLGRTSSRISFHIQHLTVRGGEFSLLVTKKKKLVSEGVQTKDNNSHDPMSLNSVTSSVHLQSLL